MEASRLNRRAPIMLSLLRVMAGLLFLAHGTQKFLSFPAGERAGSGLALDSMGAYAGMVELAAGLLVTLGSVHAACRLYRIRNDGRGLLDCPRASKLLPGEQHGRCGSPLLLRIPLFSFRRPRPAKHRRRMGAKGRNSPKLSDWSQRPLRV
jgi:hypothetical protein